MTNHTPVADPFVRALKLYDMLPSAKLSDDRSLRDAMLT